MERKATYSQLSDSGILSEINNKILNPLGYCLWLSHDNDGVIQKINITYNPDHPEYLSDERVENKRRKFACYTQRNRKLHDNIARLILEDKQRDRSNMVEL